MNPHLKVAELQRVSAIVHRPGDVAPQFPTHVTTQDVESELYVREVAIPDSEFYILRPYRGQPPMPPWEIVCEGLRNVDMILKMAREKNMQITGVPVPPLLAFLYDAMEGFDFTKPIHKHFDRSLRCTVYSQNEYRGAF